MARYEITLSNGEKILVQHTTSSTTDMLAELNKSPFLLFDEVRGSTASKDVLIGTSHVMLIRPVADHTTQGSDFRGKR